MHRHSNFPRWPPAVDISPFGNVTILFSVVHVVIHPFAAAPVRIYACEEGRSFRPSFDSSTYQLSNLFVFLMPLHYNCHHDSPTQSSKWYFLSSISDGPCICPSSTCSVSRGKVSFLTHSPPPSLSFALVNIPLSYRPSTELVNFLPFVDLLCPCTIPHPNPKLNSNVSPAPNSQSPPFNLHKSLSPSTRLRRNTITLVNLAFCCALYLSLYPYVVALASLYVPLHSIDLLTSTETRESA